MVEKRKKRRLEALLRARDVPAVRGRAQWAVNQLLWGVEAYLLGIGRMALGVHPFGIAILCAGGNGVLGVFAGLVLAELAMMEHPVLMICIYAAVAMCRVAFGLLQDTPEAEVRLPRRLRDKLTAQKREEGMGGLRRMTSKAAGALLGIFTERVCLRMILASVAALTVSLVRIAEGGFRYYDWFAALLLIGAATAAVPLFSVAVEGKHAALPLRGIAVGGLMLATVWSASFARIGDVPVSALLAMLFTLLAADRFGALWGAVAAGICGLAYAPMLIPSFLLAALLYRGVPWRERDPIAVPVSCLSGVVWSVYALGWSSAPTALVAFLGGGALMPLAARWLEARHSGKAETAQEQVRTAEEQTDPQDSRLRCAQSRYEAKEVRLRELSDAFSSLSEMLFNLSDRSRRPGTLDLRRICDGTFEGHCGSCNNRTVCWGLEYSETYAALGSIHSGLHVKGSVTREMVPQHLRRRCGSIDRILSDINEACARSTSDLLGNDRVESFAMDYRAVSEVINDALAEEESEYRFDPELEMRMREYLKDARIAVGGISVYGGRRRRVMLRGVDQSASTVTPETLRADLGEMCGVELGAPVFEVEDGLSVMLLQARRRFSVIGAQKSLSAEGEIGGDCVNLFSNGKDFFYALISDGMGSGREAAATSSLCSVFLEKMLRAGNRASTSLRMLNNLIRSRSADSIHECTTTVDLMELDLITGKASFIKSGAAPCFVIRGGTVSRLQAGTAPIGILQKLDAQVASVELRVGDTVVMVSDGALSEDAEGRLFAEFLATVRELSPERLTEAICERARAEGGRDDCSAIVLRVEKNEE